MPVGVYSGAQVSVGNGVTTVFPYGWKILDQTHIEVKVDGVVKLLGADYTVSGVGISNGGNVTFTIPPANNAVVQRRRVVPYTRVEDYQTNGDFKEETVDKDFDLREMQIQQLAAEVLRAFKAPISITADQVLTDAQWTARPNKLLGFDGAGALGVFGSADFSAVVASAFVLTLIDDPSADAFLDTLADALTAETAPASGDLVPIDDVSANSGRKMTLENLFGLYAMATMGGRLSMVTGVPWNEVSGGTTIYYAPYVHDIAWLYDGAKFVPRVFTELSLALSSDAGHAGYHQSGKNFDVFLFEDAGTLRIGTGPAWTTDTFRGAGAGTTEVSRVKGRRVNTVSITLRFGSAAGNTVVVAANRATLLGSFRAVSNGATTFFLGSTTGRARILLANEYNAIRFAPRKPIATDSYTYTTATIRQANADVENQIEIIRPNNDHAVSAIAMHFGSQSIAGVPGTTGIGLSSTSAFSGERGRSSSATNGEFQMIGRYAGHPGEGFYFLSHNELAGAVGTLTWFGDTGSPAEYQSGIAAEVWA